MITFVFTCLAANTRAPLSSLIAAPLPLPLAIDICHCQWPLALALHFSFTDLQLFAICMHAYMTHWHCFVSDSDFATQKAFWVANIGIATHVFWLNLFLPCTVTDTDTVADTIKDVKDKVKSQDTLTHSSLSDTVTVTDTDWSASASDSVSHSHSHSHTHSQVTQQPTCRVTCHCQATRPLTDSYSLSDSGSVPYHVCLKLSAIS